MPFVTGREAKMLEGLDPYQLLCVLIQKGLPIIRWDDDCALRCPCELGGVNIGRSVDDGGKISQSSYLGVFVSAYER